MRHGFQLYICLVYSKLIDFVGVLPLDKKILKMRFALIISALSLQKAEGQGRGTLGFFYPACFPIPFLARKRSMKVVSIFPARKSGSARIFRCSGMVV